MPVYNPTPTATEAEDQLRLLSHLGDPLEKLDHYIDFEAFRPILLTVFPTAYQPKGGRPRLDPVMMFKVLILQKLYGLSDHAMQFHIADRSSFQRFLKIKAIKAVPDEKTIWLFAEQIKTAGLIDQLFDAFGEKLRSSGLIAQAGKVVDATIVEVPKQRNTREENEQIKADEVPADWQQKPNKLRQKDVDARWTKKNNKSYYGYKDHIKVDVKSKLIEDYEVGPANEHDSKVLAHLDFSAQQDGAQGFWADAAYWSEQIIKLVVEDWKMQEHICEKGKRNHPLTEEQKASNRVKSKVRSRVEHVFGHMRQSMGGFFIRKIGIERAAVEVGLKNLAYNMSRAAYLWQEQDRKNTAMG